MGMFILTRRVGQAVLISNRVLLTLSEVGAVDVELAMVDHTQGQAFSIRLGLGESTEIGSNVRIALTNILPGPQANLGFEGPAGTTFHRKEVLDSMRSG